MFANCENDFRWKHYDYDYDYSFNHSTTKRINFGGLKDRQNISSIERQTLEMVFNFIQIKFGLTYRAILHFIIYTFCDH